MKVPKTIVDRIKEEKIKQIPKWYFTLQNLLIWFLCVVCVLLGAISFSIILFAIQQTDFNLISHMSHSKLEFFLGLLPFFWIIVLLISLLVSIAIFRRSRKGYKLNWLRMILLYTSASIILGTLFFIGGGAQKLENAFAQNVSSYKSVHENKMDVWMRPNDGFLAGTIVEQKGDSTKFLDFNDKIWNIEYRDAFISRRVLLKKGEQVKLIGEITQGNNFSVKEIRPWKGSGQQHRRNNRVKEN